jgi:hypothetical protein
MGEMKCLPGDVTVSTVPGGFVVGRVLEERGPGPWWAYIRTAGNLTEAIAMAHDEAEHHRARAWLDCGLGNYRELPALSELTLCQS